MLAIGSIIVSACPAHAGFFSAESDALASINKTHSAVNGELQDGTKIEIVADGTISVVHADGTKSPVADGAHALKDGTTITTKVARRLLHNLLVLPLLLQTVSTLHQRPLIAHVAARYYARNYDSMYSCL